MNKFPKQLWFTDYPNHPFELLEEKNIEGYALYICRNSSVEKIRRVHVSSFNGTTKVAFLSGKEMIEYKIFLLERELEYWKTQLD